MNREEVYDKEAIRKMVLENPTNNEKQKGSKATTPKQDGIQTDIKSMSITHDVDGSVFGVSFHCNPRRFYTFVLPDEYYDMFDDFIKTYLYGRTPKKTILKEDAFAGLTKLKPKITKGGSALLQDLDLIN